MSSKRPKLPIAKGKLKLSLADTTKSKTENPASPYKQLQSTIIAPQQAPANTPNHTTEVADHPLIVDARKGPLEATQVQSTHHHTIVSPKNFEFHLLQHYRISNLQEDTQAATTLLCHKRHTSQLDP